MEYLRVNASKLEAPTRTLDQNRKQEFTMKIIKSSLAVVARRPGQNVGEKEEDAIYVTGHHAVGPHAWMADACCC